jgi:hypothetical protein
VNREPIALAIIDQIKLLTEPPYDLDIPTISRKWQIWSDVSEQPAIFTVPMLEVPTFVRGLPTKWTATFDLWVYAKGDGDILGVQKVNAMLDALETIFAPSAVNAPPNAYVNTLGGLVHRAALAGPTEIEGGYLGEQAVGKMTLEIVTA